MQYLKKITLAMVGIQAKDAEKVAVENAGKTVPVMRVYGRAMKAESKTSNYGPYYLFKGEFEAVNLITGDKSRSTNLILPTGTADMALKSIMDERENETEAVQFGLDVTVEENKSTQGGWKFRYGVKSLVDSKGKDAISQIGDGFGKAPVLSLTDKTAKNNSKK